MHHQQIRTSPKKKFRSKNIVTLIHVINEKCVIKIRKNKGYELYINDLLGDDINTQKFCHDFSKFLPPKTRILM